VAGARNRSDYGNTNASLLAAHGRRAFCEYMPVRQTQAETGRIYRKISYGPLLDVFLLDMRSYRGPNGKPRHGDRAGRRHPRRGARPNG